MNQPNQRNTLFLYIVMMVGLLLRAALAWRLPLIGDEVGTWIYMQEDAKVLLTEFREPWLSMGPFILLCKIIGAVISDHPFVLRLPVVLAGTLTIPLVAAVSRQLGGKEKTILIASILTAFNPYLVSQSANLRSYALLIFGSVGGLYYLLRWLDKKTWFRGATCAALCGFGWLAHFNMVYSLVVLGVLGIVFLFFPWSNRQFTNRLWSARTITIPLVFLLFPALLYHLAVWDDLVTFKHNWSGSFPSSIDYLPGMTASYLGRGWLAVPSLFLLFGGWIPAVRNDPKRAGIIATGIITPILLYSITGSQHYPWGSTRLLVVILPFVLIHLSFTVSDLRVPAWAASGLLVLILATWAPANITSWKISEHYPWREAQAYLVNHAGTNAWIIAPGHGKIHLTPGFKADPHKLLSASEYIPRHSNTADTPQTLYFLTTVSFANSTSPIKHLGNIEIFRYEGTNRYAIASNLVHDIQAMFKGKADPGAVSLAKDALILMGDLSWPADERLEMQRIYYHSQFRSVRGRFMPKSQRDILFP